MKANPKALVIHGDGINCDRETGFVLEQVGFTVTPVHTREILENPSQIQDYQLIVLPGGFSFGDEIASGKILAIELKQRLNDGLHNYIDNGGFVIGICNGFQVLVQLGILPVSEKGAKRVVSLARNSGGHFINKWVSLKVRGNSVFLKGLAEINLPIRHGEGRLTLGEDADSLVANLVKGHSVLEYDKDINGSFDRIAGLVNTKGNVFGLMPHPEAFIRWSQHPAWTEFKRAGDRREEPHGLTILKNVAEAISK